MISYNAKDNEKVVYTREDDVMAQVEAALDTLRIRDEGKLADVLSYVKSSHKDKKHHHVKHTGQLKKEHSELETKLDRLTELRLEGEFTKEEFAAQKKRLKDRQYDIVELIHAYDVTDDEFSKRLSYLIEVAAGALDEFRGSGLDQKRELLKFVFQNLQLNGKNLEYTMAKPFEIIAECNKTGEWCG